MNNYKWSPGLKLFFLTSYLDTYVQNGWDLSDSVDIEDSVQVEFSQSPPDGKEIGLGSDGLPAWIDAQPLPHAALVAIAETEKRNRIGTANDFMNSKQWPGKAAIGRLKGGDLAQYNLWLDYLDALEAVDTSNAPDIEWPEKPA